MSRCGVAFCELAGVGGAREAADAGEGRAGEGAALGGGVAPLESLLANIPPRKLRRLGFAASASFSFSSAARLAASFSLAVSGFAGAPGASPSGVAWSEARVSVRVRCFVRATG